MKVKAWAAIGICLAAFFFASGTLRPWRHDFPLNDDWMYGLEVRHLLQEKRLVLCDEVTPTRLAHLAWGWLASQPMGFSFGGLRVSTLLLAGAAVALFGLILAECAVTAEVILLATLCLAFNPLFFLLSHSFMTDVPYLFWMLLSLAAFLRFRRSSAGGWLWAASLAAGGAYLVRQIGFFLPFVYTGFLLWEHRFSRKAALQTWLFPTAAVLSFNLWLHLVHGPTWAVVNDNIVATLGHVLAPLSLFKDILFRTLGAALEAGLFVFPLAAGFGIPLLRAGLGKGSAAPATRRLVLGYVLLGIVFLCYAGPLPHLENNLSSCGLGSMTVTAPGAKPSGVFRHEWFWILGSMVGLLSSAVVLLAGCLTWQEDARTGDQSRNAHVVFAAVAVQFAFALLRSAFYDRYLLGVVVGALLILARAARLTPFSLRRALLATCLLGGLTYAGTRDYLSWNLAKWTAGLSAGQVGVAPQDIIGGWDWDGYWNYEAAMSQLKSNKPLRSIRPFEWLELVRSRPKAWLSFQPAARGVLVEAHYSTPLSRDGGIIYVTH